MNLEQRVELRRLAEWAIKQPNMALPGTVADVTFGKVAIPAGAVLAFLDNYEKIISHAARATIFCQLPQGRFAEDDCRGECYSCQLLDMVRKATGA